MQQQKAARQTSSKLILFVGGARSGKSVLAEEIVRQYGRVAYVATAEAVDAEMIERIRKHRESRSGGWVTYEVDELLEQALAAAFKDSEAVIIDCLTVYVARRMIQTANDDEIIDEAANVAHMAKESGKTVVIVTNEVGMGIVPEYPSGRRYRDLLGKVNQQVAEVADKVLFTVAGIPVDIKSLRTPII
ncbi:MAG TPA: bifunctional adenosylcobinamide kinase/adenosylcobinamide-phosphate guanylyltransferase [Candidatus Aquicultor sp.]